MGFIIAALTATLGVVLGIGIQNGSSNGTSESGNIGVRGGSGEEPKTQSPVASDTDTLSRDEPPTFQPAQISV